MKIQGSDGMQLQNTVLEISPLSAWASMATGWMLAGRHSPHEVRICTKSSFIIYSYLFNTFRLLQNCTKDKAFVNTPAVEFLLVRNNRRLDLKRDRNPESKNTPFVFMYQVHCTYIFYIMD